MPVRRLKFISEFPSDLSSKIAFSTNCLIISRFVYETKRIARWFAEDIYLMKNSSVDRSHFGGKQLLKTFLRSKLKLWDAIVDWKGILFIRIYWIDHWKKKQKIKIIAFRFHLCKFMHLMYNNYIRFEAKKNIRKYNLPKLNLINTVFSYTKVLQMTCSERRTEQKLQIQFSLYNQLNDC